MSRQTPPEAENGEPDGWVARVETCRIVLWRGYLTSAFYASVGGDSPGASVVEPSPAFRLRRSAIESDEARRAYRQVLSRLTAEGWTPTGQGSEWYATELARQVLVPVDDDIDGDALPELEPQPDVQQPEPVAAASEPRALRAGDALPPPRRADRRPHPDRWRVAAAAGLMAAIVLLGWFATHPSAFGATGLRQRPALAPQQMSSQIVPPPRSSSVLVLNSRASWPAAV